MRRPSAATPATPATAPRRAEATDPVSPVFGSCSRAGAGLAGCSGTGFTGVLGVGSTGVFGVGSIGLLGVGSTGVFGVGYGEPLARVNMVVTRGDNVAIMGVNGCGKSTFIKTLMGEVPQIAGKFSFGERVNVGYFSQDLGNLDFDKCIYEEIEEEASNLSSQEIRGLLGSFGFSGDDVFKRIRDLSGGEKVRVSLCKVFYKRPNVLILDEPTNHLDIVNRENIQKILGNYEGTIILVSHDRYLIRNVCDRIVVMDGKGEECRIFEGGYDEYLEKREQERNLSSNVNVGKEKKSGKARNSVNGKGKEESAERRALRLEREIVALEERLGSLNEELLKEEVYMDASRARLVQVEIDLVQGDIERKTAEWDRIVSEM